jgi:Ca2+-binding RTX toxin-like protein
MNDWVKQNPFFSSLLVLLAVVLPGFWRMENINNGLEEQVTANTRFVEHANATNACLVTYAEALTDALQDRDTINTVARGAMEDVWKLFRKLLNNPQPDSREVFSETLNDYLEVLDRVGNTSEINPYPDISSCLPPDILKLVSYSSFPGSWDNRCLGKTVTLRGTQGDDVLHGTDGNDVIFAYSGDDVISAGKGHDRVCGRTGDDIIHGGQDFDQARCGRGRDIALQTEVQRSC